MHEEIGRDPPPSEFVLYSVRGNSYNSLKLYQRAIEDFDQTPQLGGDWQGKDLMLYVPATKPRTIFDKELLETMRSWSANIAPAAPEAAHDYSKSKRKAILKRR